MQLKPCLEGEIIDLKSSIRREKDFISNLSPNEMNTFFINILNKLYYISGSIFQLRGTDELRKFPLRPQS